jgi:hypothetical protein
VIIEIFRIHGKTPVIPAQAGIQNFLGPGFRRDDGSNSRMIANYGGPHSAVNSGHSPPVLLSDSL